jgi:Holliday junction DNA helicase RuvB
MAEKWKYKVIGNENIITQLRIAVTSARARNASVPHTMFAGPPGTGKTTTARMIAERLGTKFLQGHPDSLKTYKDLKPLVGQFSMEGYDEAGKVTGNIKPTILFLDEIHNLPLKGQEMLGIAMENFILPMPSQHQEFVRWIPQFTLIGATTDEGKLAKPFRDRFNLRFHFSTYSLDEATEIIIYHAGQLGIGISGEAVGEIARRSRGVPRIMVGLLKRCRDTALSLGRDVIEKWTTLQTFKMMGLNQEGLNLMDIKLLKTLFSTNKPMGEQNLSVVLSESPENIRNSMEPYLIQKGLMVRGPRGREITDKGIRYLSHRGYIDKMEAMRILIERS